MKKTNLLVLSLALILSLILVFGCAPKPAPAPTPTPTPTPAPTPTPTPTPGKVYEWTFITPVPFGTQPHQLVFLDAFKKATAGRINIKTLEPGEHSYGMPDLVGAVRDGLAQLAYGGTFAVGGIEPILALVDLPFMFSGLDEFNAFMEDPNFQDFWTAGFRDILSKRWNQTPLQLYGWPDINISADVFLESFDSLRGKKMRAHTELISKMWTVLNAVPVPVVYGEVYTALQRGLVEGWTTDFAGPSRMGWFESVKYTTFVPSYQAMAWFVVNNDALNELPKDLQDIVLKVGADTEQPVRQFIIDSFEELLVSTMQKYGVRTSYSNPAFREKAREAMRPIWNEWVAKTGGGAAELVQRVDEFHKKWMAKAR